MHEDAHLEAQYEDRNGGTVSTSDLIDVDGEDMYDYQYCGPEELDTH